MVDMTELDVWAVTTPPRADLLPGLRGRVGRWLQDHHVPTEQRESIVWIADEAVSNAIAHGAAGPVPISLSLHLDTETVVVTVVDQPRPGGSTVPAGLAQGVGLRMVRALADRVDLVSEPGRTTFTACCARSE